MSINRVVLIGRLTRDPELRNTTTGKQVVNFGLAVDDTYNKEHTNFFNVSAWGKTAEFVQKYCAKGRLVAVDGRLNQRKYTTKDGEERNVVEIVADSVQGLERPKDSESPDPVTPSAEDYDPFQSE